MPKKQPPYCYICEKNFEKSVDRLYYCICDHAVCDKCVNSLKKNDKVWICPNCKNENDLEESRLFRLT